MKKKPTQKEVILDMLQNEKLVSPIQVFRETQKRCDSACMRLAARIKDLKDDGHKIVTRSVITKTGHVAYYELAPFKKVKTNKNK